MNKKYLPSKKFIKVALVSLGALFAIYFIILYTKTYRSLKNPEIITSTMPAQALIEKDTDGDGVRDWEEILWGTNINLASTFGMPDKEYINNKRKDVALVNNTSVVNTENLNDTDKFSREFFSTIIALKESGNLNSFNIANLATKFSSDLGSTANLAQNYTSEDIKLSSDTLTEKKAYYSKFSKALADAYNNGMGYELVALSDFAKSEDLNNAQIIKISNYYKALTKALLEMKAPPSAQKMHLDLVNISDNMYLIFKNISQVENDSLIGLIAISQFNANEEKLEKTIQEFLAYFKASAIIN